MLTETGKLPRGVKYDGKTHKDFELREQVVSDMIDVFDDSERAARAEKNNYFLGVCILCKMIMNIGTIPQEAITPEMILGMAQADLNEIKAAETRLEKKRKSFRDADEEK